VTKFIPWSDQAFSRCGSESHRYCDLYLALARTSSPAPAAGEPAPGSDDADGIPVPRWLWFAPGHTWLDVASDGVCHIGVDAFLARTLGGIDRVQFVTPKGLERPAAVLTVRDVDITVCFPNPVLITGVNGALRADPARLARDPYGLGWLFEGIVRDRATLGPGTPRITDGLLRGEPATAWMRREGLRLRALAESASERMSGVRLAADGGLPAPGLIRTLPHEEALRLSHLLLSTATDEERFS
jgi:glycine cleavage system H lipoate-binding protein